MVFTLNTPNESLSVTPLFNCVFVYYWWFCIIGQISGGIKRCIKSVKKELKAQVPNAPPDTGCHHVISFQCSAENNAALHHKMIQFNILYNVNCCYPLLEVLMLFVAIMFISLCQQAKQQILFEDHAVVNETIDTAQGFISETERTVEDVDAIVQVRPSWCTRTNFFLWGMGVSGGIWKLCPFAFLWRRRVYHNLIEW